MALRQLNALADGMRAVDNSFVVSDDPLALGIQQAISARWCPDQASPLLQNVDLSDVSRPKRRDGFERIGIGTGGITSRAASLRLAEIAYLNPRTGTKLLVAFMPDNGAGKVFYTPNPDNVNWAEALTAAGASYDVQTDNAKAFQANDRLWVLPGGSVLPAVLDNTGVLTLSGATSDDMPQNAVDGLYFLNRVWLAVANVVYWSDALPTTPVGTFDQTAQRLSFSPNAGSSIVGMRAWRNTSIIIFFNDSIEELVVDNAPSSSILSSDRNVLEHEIGCASRYGILAIGDDIYFVDHECRIRTLKQTEEGSLNGVVAQPLSADIEPEIPGRVNAAAKHKMRLVLEGDELHVYYPRDASTECDYRAVFDFATRRWTSIDALGYPCGAIARSNIRGGPIETFMSKGTSGASASPLVYIWEQGTFLDDDVAIPFTERTAAIGLQVPEATKVPEWFELEYYGDVGVTPSVKYRLGEVGSFTALTLTTGDAALAAAADSDFPLVPDDFPLEPGDFPLTSSAAPLARARYTIGADLLRNRTIEFEISESSEGLAFHRVGWRFVSKIEEFQMEPTA